MKKVIVQKDGFTIIKVETPNTVLVEVRDKNDAVVESAACKDEQTANQWASELIEYLNSLHNRSDR